MTRQVLLLIAIGLLLNSTGLLMGIILPHMPDVARGMITGTGTGIILGGFIKWRMGNSVCEKKEKAI